MIASQLGFILIALFLIWSQFGAEIQGQHAFRQAHVMGQIEKFEELGISLYGVTWNLDTPGYMYDFPIYQWAIVLMAQSTGVDSLLVARITSFVVFVCSAFVLDALLQRCGASRRMRWFSFGAFVLAPVNLFYNSVPFVDGLAVLAACAMTWCYVDLEHQGSRWRTVLVSLCLVVVTIAGVMIKIPVFIPVCFGVLIYSIKTHRMKAFRTLSTLLAGASVVSGTFLFLLCSRSVNGGRSIASYSWMFGAKEKWLDGDWLNALAGHLTTDLMGFTTVWAALAGLVLMRFTSNRFRWIAMGAFAGSCFYLVVFSNLHFLHSYYQLPFVPVLAVFAGLLWSVPGMLAARFLGRVPKLAGFISVLVCAGFLVVQIKEAQVGLADLRSWSTQKEQDRGSWIRANTAADSFVVYVVEATNDWNPYYLYYAQRNGTNIGIKELDTERLLEALEQSLTRPRRATPYDGFFLFIPTDLAEAGRRIMADIRVFRIAAEHEGNLLYLLGPP